MGMDARVQPGPDPFQQSFLDHRAAVLRLLVGMVGPDVAQDCFQDTFLKALRAWPPGEVGDRIGGWLLTIAHRTALDQLRRARPDSPDALLELEPAPGHVPVLARLDAPELWAAVRALPEQQRAAVVLHVVLDRTHAQAAAVMGCSDAAARRSYADGVAALRRQVEQGTLEVNG